MKEIPTLQEREVEMERVAIARCVAKRDRWPTARDVQKEQSVMTMSAIHGEPVEPKVTRADATAWLRAKGLTIPKPEKK